MKLNAYNIITTGPQANSLPVVNQGSSAGAVPTTLVNPSTQSTVYPPSFQLTNTFSQQPVNIVNTGQSFPVSQAQFPQQRNAISSSIPLTFSSGSQLPFSVPTSLHSAISASSQLQANAVSHQQVSQPVSFAPSINNRLVAADPPSPTSRLTCGRPVVPASGGRVLGGDEARPHSWPWQVAIKHEQKNSAKCAGSVIAPQWILTTAHCMDE